MPIVCVTGIQFGWVATGAKSFRVLSGEGYGCLQ